MFLGTTWRTDGATTMSIVRHQPPAGYIGFIDPQVGATSLTPFKAMRKGRGQRMEMRAAKARSAAAVRYRCFEDREKLRELGDESGQMGRARDRDRPFWARRWKSLAKSGGEEAGVPLDLAALRANRTWEASRPKLGRGLRAITCRRDT